MSGSFQQQSLVRKLTYFGIIVLLLTATVVLRKQFINAKSSELQIREENLGEVGLTDSALRLTLTGSRGLAICALWVTANEKQMKHEWNELELVVNSLTKLQPHFITPWLFQSWNLAYNVSVESDRVKDKYFYVTRGIELLGEGERRNHNNPDLRMNMGLYYQNKLGMADEANTFRSLFQLSYIDPKDRDPDRFRQQVNDRTVLNLAEFEAFCREQPHLVRRLRDRLRCDTPDKVVEFLADNRKVPGRYEEDPDLVRNQSRSPMKAAERRFPILPPPSIYDPSDYNNDSPLPFDVDNFDVARAWYKYSMDPAEDPNLQRRPRHLALVIFQSQPARAGAYHAEHLEKNGWFDKDGWEIRDWFPVDKARPFAAKKVVRVGEDRAWAAEAWAKAFYLIERHGRDHGLLVDPALLPTLDREKQMDYAYGRNVTNFAHFYAKSQVERMPEAVDGRKHFYKAEELRRRALRREAVAEYEHPSAFGPAASWAKADAGWKKIFQANPDFRKDNEEQQDIYETQMKYLRLVEELRGVTLRRLVVLQDFLGQAALRSPLATTYLPGAGLVREFPIILQGPFDGVDASGQPWIDPMVVVRVRGNAARGVGPN